MSNKINDMNNGAVIKLGPEEIKQILYQQIGFYKSKEKRDPNCCMLGLAVITVLDQVTSFTHNNKTGGTYFEGLKVYLDGDNECTIGVGYNPFISKQGIIV